MLVRVREVYKDTCEWKKRASHSKLIKKKMSPYHYPDAALSLQPEIAVRGRAQSIRALLAPSMLNSEESQYRRVRK